MTVPWSAKFLWGKILVLYVGFGNFFFFGFFFFFFFLIATVHQSTQFNDLNLRGCSNRLCIGGCYFILIPDESCSGNLFAIYSVGVGVRDQKYQISQKMECVITHHHKSSPQTEISNLICGVRIFCIISHF